MKMAAFAKVFCVTFLVFFIFGMHSASGDTRVPRELKAVFHPRVGFHSDRFKRSVEDLGSENNDPFEEMSIAGRSRKIKFKLNNFMEQMNNGKLLLAKYRKMSENLNKPTILTQATGSINFGSKISLLAPHVAASDPPSADKKGLLLGGRIASNDLDYYQELKDQCSLVGLPNLKPVERAAFVITSPDYCNRSDEVLKYNQDFMLTLSSTVGKDPLYMRYDPNPIPGLLGKFPVYLSKHPVSNARWRVLPVQKNNITRFEQEGLPIKVNEDVIINHCSTNSNLAINSGSWALGFHGKICSVIVKTILNIYNCEVPENIWQIYSAIPD